MKLYFSFCLYFFNNLEKNKIYKDSYFYSILKTKFFISYYYTVFKKYWNGKFVVFRHLFIICIIFSYFSFTLTISLFSTILSKVYRNSKYEFPFANFRWFLQQWTRVRFLLVYVYFFQLLFVFITYGFDSWYILPRILYH